MAKIILGYKGAASSGNRMHAGRPGMVGGSKPRNYGAAASAMQNNYSLQHLSIMYNIDMDKLNRVGLQALIDYNSNLIDSLQLLDIVQDPNSQKFSKMAPVNPNAPSTAKYFTPKGKMGTGSQQAEEPEHDPTQDFRDLGWIIPDRNNPGQDYTRSAHNWISGIGTVDAKGKQALQDFKAGSITEDQLKSILTAPKPVKLSPKSSANAGIVKAKYTDPTQLPCYNKINRGLIDERAANGGDGILDAIVKDQGFDGKPQVISRAEFNQYVKQGEIAIYRGTSSGKSASYRASRYKDFREGEYYAGYGIHGNGTYTSTEIKTGRDYDRGSDGTTGVMAMTIKPGAKIIDENDVHDKLGVYGNNYGRTGSRERDYSAAESSIQNDIGRIAAANGYDAIRVKNADYNGSGEDFYVVLNRTILRVVDSEFK